MRMEGSPSREAAEKQRSGSSDEEEASFSEEELPAGVVLDPVAANLPLLVARTRQLYARRGRLRAAEATLRARLDSGRRKKAEFSLQCETNIQDLDRCHAVLQTRVEALENEHADLRARASQATTEQSQLMERLREAKGQNEETEKRIAWLMDHLVTLLSSNSASDVVQAHYAEVVQELGVSKERLSRQLASLQGQHEAARAENRRKALQLSDEQRRTKRLHDTLCQLQAELFHRRGSRRSLAEASGAKVASALVVGRGSEEPVVAESAPGDRPLVAQGLGASPLPGACPESAPDAGAGPHVGCWEECAAGASTMTSASVAPLPAVRSKASGESAARLRATEEALCEALEVAQFGSLVLRLGNGYYQFGDSVRACIRLKGDNEVLASANGDDFEPLKDFIVKMKMPPVSEKENSVAGAMSVTASPATESPAMGLRAATDAMCGNMMDPSWTPAPQGQANGADTSSFAARLEASAGAVSPAPVSPGSPVLGSPGPTTRPLRQRSPRKLHAGDDAAGQASAMAPGQVAVAASPGEPLCSPQSYSRGGGGDAAGGAACPRPRGERKGAATATSPSAATVASTATPLRRSPPRRSRSPVPGEAAPGSGGSGALLGGGSGSYGSGSHATVIGGSGSHSGGGSARPGAKSPIRLGLRTGTGGSAALACRGLSPVSRATTPGRAVTPGRALEAAAGASTTASAPASAAAAAPSPGGALGGSRPGTPREAPRWRQPLSCAPVSPVTCGPTAGGGAASATAVSPRGQAPILAGHSRGRGHVPGVQSWASPPRNSVLPRSLAPAVAPPGGIGLGAPAGRCVSGPPCHMATAPVGAVATHGAVGTGLGAAVGYRTPSTSPSRCAPSRAATALSNAVPGPVPSLPLRR